MPMPSPDTAGFSSARRIVPIAVAVGLVLIVPLAFYLLSRDGITQDGDLGYTAVYLVAAFSAILAFALFFLVFLWGAEYADEEEERQYHELHPGEKVRSGTATDTHTEHQRFDTDTGEAPR